VLRVLSENGKAIGVTYRRKRKIHRAYAQTIVISAGGIGSPVILRQSGITEAGYDFFFDPLIVVMGTADDLKGGRGEIPMACGMHVEEDGYIMTDMAVPLTLHMAFNAEMGRFGQMHKHKRTLQIMVKIKDQLGGALTDKGGVRKRMTEFDKVKIYKGYARARDILAHAGAKNIHRSWYLAAHPGGTVKINHLVDSDLKTEIDNLYVCDCSVIPESWGRPPVLTLLGLGRRLAKHLSGELVGGKEKRRTQEPAAD
jgi:choline dehydrogenase-like flavoprotein